MPDKKPPSIGPAFPNTALPQPQGSTVLGEMPLTPGGVGSILGGLKSLWGSGAAPKAISGLQGALRPASETLGEVSPEFTPVGGEGMYNAGKAGLQKIADPMESVYQKIRGTMGAKLPAPQTPFQSLESSGAFQGPRTTGSFPMPADNAWTALSQLYKSGK